MPSAIPKLLVLGPSCCGKTSFLDRIQRGTYTPYQCITVYYDVMRWKHQLQLFDMGGADKYYSMLPTMFPLANAFLLCLDCTNRKTFEQNEVQTWISYIRTKSQAPIFLVRLKSEALNPYERAFEKRFYLGVIDLGYCSAKEDSHPERLLEWITMALKNPLALAGLHLFASRIQLSTVPEPLVLALSRNVTYSETDLQTPSNTEAESSGSQSPAPSYVVTVRTPELSYGS